MKHYKLTIIHSLSNEEIDSTNVQYPKELPRTEVLKRCRFWVNQLGFKSKYYKLSLITL